MPYMVYVYGVAHEKKRIETVMRNLCGYCGSCRQCYC